MTEEQADVATDVVPTLYALACFVTITALTLADQVVQLPGAAAALASGWWVVRAGSRVDRPANL